MDFAIKRVLLKPEDQTDNTREAIREVCRRWKTSRHVLRWKTTAI